MKEPTRPVSIRVPESMPDKIRAITGMTFSQAVVNMLEAFIHASKTDATTTPPEEPSHD